MDAVDEVMNAMDAIGRELDGAELRPDPAREDWASQAERLEETRAKLEADVLAKLREATDLLASEGPVAQQNVRDGAAFLAAELGAPSGASALAVSQNLYSDNARQGVHASYTLLEQPPHRAYGMRDPMSLAAFVFRPDQFAAELVLAGFSALRDTSPNADAFAGERLVARPIATPTRDHRLTAVFYVPPGLDDRTATETLWETFLVDGLPRFVLQNARARRTSFCCYVVVWDEWGHDLCGWKLEPDAVELRSIIGDQALVDIDFLDGRPPRHREREMRFRGKKAFESSYSILRMIDRELSLSLLQLRNASLPALRPDRYDETSRGQNQSLYPTA